MDSFYPWVVGAGGLVSRSLSLFLSAPRGAHVWHMNLFFLCVYVAWYTQTRQHTNRHSLSLSNTHTHTHTHRWQCLDRGATSVALCGRVSRLSACSMAFINGMTGERAMTSLMNWNSPPLFFLGHESKSNPLQIPFGHHFVQNSKHSRIDSVCYGTLACSLMHLNNEVRIALCIWPDSMDTGNSNDICTQGQGMVGCPPGALCDRPGFGGCTCNILSSGGRKCSTSNGLCKWLIQVFCGSCSFKCLLFT